MGPANVWRRYTVRPFLIGMANAQNDPANGTWNQQETYYNHNKTK